MENDDKKLYTVKVDKINLKYMVFFIEAFGKECVLSTNYRNNSYIIRTEKDIDMFAKETPWIISVSKYNGVGYNIVL